jgi:hypothetical protein
VQCGEEWDRNVQRISGKVTLSTERMFKKHIFENALGIFADFNYVETKCAALTALIFLWRWVPGLTRWARLWRATGAETKRAQAGVPVPLEAEARGRKLEVGKFARREEKPLRTA